MEWRRVGKPGLQPPHASSPAGTCLTVSQADPTIPRSSRPSSSSRTHLFQQKQQEPAVSAGQPPVGLLIAGPDRMQHSPMMATIQWATAKQQNRRHAEQHPGCRPFRLGPPTVRWQPLSVIQSGHLPHTCSSSQHQLLHAKKQCTRQDCRSDNCIQQGAGYHRPRPRPRPGPPNGGGPPGPGNGRGPPRPGPSGGPGMKGGGPPRPGPGGPPKKAGGAPRRRGIGMKAAREPPPTGMGSGGGGRCRADGGGDLLRRRLRSPDRSRSRRRSLEGDASLRLQCTRGKEQWAQSGDGTMRGAAAQRRQPLDT